MEGRGVLVRRGELLSTVFLEWLFLSFSTQKLHQLKTKTNLFLPGLPRGVQVGILVMLLAHFRLELGHTAVHTSKHGEWVSCSIWFPQLAQNGKCQFLFPEGVAQQGIPNFQQLVFVICLCRFVFCAT